MKNFNRNILVLLKSETLSEKAIEQEVENIHDILLITESTESFCIAHELVNRNSITSKRNIILRETQQFYLRPFRFLINKN
jgi:hypothetical protein